MFGRKTSDAHSRTVVGEDAANIHRVGLLDTGVVDVGGQSCGFRQLLCGSTSRYLGHSSLHLELQFLQPVQEQAE